MVDLKNLNQKLNQIESQSDNLELNEDSSVKLILEDQNQNFQQLEELSPQKRNTYIQQLKKSEQSVQNSNQKDIQKSECEEKQSIQFKQNSSQKQVNEKIQSNFYVHNNSDNKLSKIKINEIQIENNLNTQTALKNPSSTNQISTFNSDFQQQQNLLMSKKSKLSAGTPKLQVQSGSTKISPNSKNQEQSQNQNQMQNQNQNLQQQQQYQQQIQVQSQNSNNFYPTNSSFLGYNYVQMSAEKKLPSSQMQFSAFSNNMDTLKNMGKFQSQRQHNSFVNNNNSAIQNEEEQENGFELNQNQNQNQKQNQNQNQNQNYSFQLENFVLESPGQMKYQVDKIKKMKQKPILSQKWKRLIILVKYKIINPLLVSQYYAYEQINDLAQQYSKSKAQYKKQLKFIQKLKNMYAMIPSISQE
ncbi:hypothetical protein PPERSA_09164 [Pseudocohnilembus persalinus]|uniref:Uncharacterized protein n=1 Tax=Pseudocohnilembus persalinus TaxID=266149 RepID=A0A0V0QXG6_PSEPJ|nr:hypothetical protein PPERSA_09164 [Pseudocohnilembus persalinus]|eukprot:KRX06762.1 hypothetical protein PPERSA_09164 [Pseudocohnilembus persalinus]